LAVDAVVAETPEVGEAWSFLSLSPPQPAAITAIEMTVTADTTAFVLFFILTLLFLCTFYNKGIRHY
jgi:hypothetical protein